ncbi:MAG: right-handed parallel beta-helix repeat-containing protein [Kiritimatiellae bacterium]|nr:right-handed parallel beta-helix repeat-containing protein [Kiritimatiellia bacterium]
MKDITKYGAVGDGVTDNTKAIQAALDDAVQCGEIVLVPEGEFLTGGLTVPNGVRGIQGVSPASYQNQRKGSVLKLKRDGAPKALLDLSGCKDLFCRDMSLVGFGRRGDDPKASGICVDIPSHGGHNGMGSCIVLDGLNVGDFSLDGVHMQNAGVITMRHCIVGGSGRHGLLANIWDGWILDCMFPGNVLCGIYSDDSVASITITGNRIEWNAMAGVRCRNAYRLSLVGNTIDYSGYEGMYFEDSNSLAISGNVFWRSGCSYDKPPAAIPTEVLSDPLASAHARFKRCRGISFTGNVLHAGLKGDRPGAWAPDYGIVLEGMSHSVFTGNSLWGAGAKDAIYDGGGHGDGLEVAMNPATIASAEND